MFKSKSSDLMHPYIIFLKYNVYEYIIIVYKQSD